MSNPFLTLDISTPSHQALVAITDAAQQAISSLALDNGVLHLFVQHTTCGLMVNENADPDVCRDVLLRLEKMIPWNDVADRHGEGNTAAHLRSILVGSSVSLPVKNGRLHLGTWQGVFLAEFDGPRRRHITATALRADY